MKRIAVLWRALASVMAALSPDCRQAARLQSEAMDHKLPTVNGIGLRIHLVLCRWCRRYGRQLRFLRRAAHAHPGSLADPSQECLTPAARDRIKERLRARED